MRNSIVIWVAGAVLGWGVAVVSVLSVLNRTENSIAANAPTVAEKLDTISPAANNKKDTENLVVDK